MKNMERPHRQLDLEEVNSTSYFNKRRIEDVAKEALKFFVDPDRKERLLAQECKVCYYGSFISGQSFTTWYCGVCGKSDIHPNTGVPRLCISCSKEYELCKSCGGTLDDGQRRKIKK